MGPKKPSLKFLKPLRLETKEKKMSKNKIPVLITTDNTKRGVFMGLTNPAQRIPNNETHR